MENDGNGNGHDGNEFPGAIVPHRELLRRDGVFAEQADKAGKEKQGVIQTYIHAPDYKQELQILLQARWRNPEEAIKATAALDICHMTGAENARKAILRRIIALSAGDNGENQKLSYQAIMHTSYSFQGFNKNKWWSNDRNKDRNNSPIAP